MVPRSNMQDIIVDKKKLKQIKIIPVDNILDVWKEALDWTGKKELLKKITK